MSGDGLLLDSVVLIDHLNGIAAASKYIESVAGRARISAITRAEVLAGFDPLDSAPVRQLLDTFPLLPVDAPVADLAAELRRTVRWRLPDAIQAATAIHHGLRFATRNLKDFPPKRFEFVIVPY